MNIVRDRYDVGPRTAALEELNGALMGAFFDEGRNPYEMKITGAVPTHQVEIERLNAGRFSIEYLLIEQGAPSMTGTVPAVRVGFQDWVPTLVARGAGLSYSKYFWGFPVGVSVLNGLCEATDTSYRFRSW